MNRIGSRNRTQIIIWSIVSVFILTVLIVSLVLPGVSEGFKLFDGWPISINAGARLQYDDAAKYTAGPCAYDDVRALDINWVAGSVSVIGYDGDEVKAAEEGDAADAPMYHYFDEAKGILRIQFAKSGEYVGTTQKTLTVYVPMEQMQEMELDVVSADILLDTIYTDALEVDSVSGVITLENVTANEAKFDMVSGDIVGNNVKLTKTEADAVSGNVYLTFAECLPQCFEMDSVSGDVTLVLPESIGFSLDADTRHFTSDFGVSVRDNHYVYGSGDFIIQVDGVSSRVTINKAK